MTFKLCPFTMALAFAALLPMIVSAQTANIAFGGLRADTSLPVEATADQLSVNQSDGTAIFSGNVVIIQGEMRLSAAEVRIEYAEGNTGKIERLLASGGVVLANGKDAAESAEAVYTIASGEVILTGNVLLAQSGGTLAGEKLIVDLNTGTGRMDGRVRTVLQPTGN
ncbi:MAG: LptA/OstA family protein [Albidovulum sp.]